MSEKKRILVLGCPGVGKTFFSEKLGEKLNIPVIHLDDYYWKSGWRSCTPEEWVNLLIKLCKKDEYIMDGNYADSLELRTKFANKVIYIKSNLGLCIWGYIRRTIINYTQQGRQLPLHIRQEKGYRLSEKGFFHFIRYICSCSLKQKEEIKWLLEVKNIDMVILTPKELKRRIENQKDIFR